MKPRARSDSLIKALKEASPLTDEEVVWRDRYEMLESHGYRLRQRYKPGWTPSWIYTKRPIPLHEDFKKHWSTQVIDAIRVSDGRTVFLKRVFERGKELTIHRFLSDETKIQDPQNHTIPLLDVFPDDKNPRFVYMVMPFLRPYDFPEFFSVDEVVDFVKQVLEGLVYTHKENVAHRDCSDLNIMMDADALYPKGMHAKNMFADATGVRSAHPKRRRDVLPLVRYYFIDFGISSMFSPDEQDIGVLGLDCQDDEVPELSDRIPYDPFRVDLFIVGNLFKNAFLDKYDNVTFLYPLIDDLRQPDPGARGTAILALKTFNTILAQQSPRSLRRRLKPKSLGKFERFRYDADSLRHESIVLTKKITSSVYNDVRHFVQTYLSSARQSRRGSY